VLVGLKDAGDPLDSGLCRMLVILPGDFRDMKKKESRPELRLLC